ncbi:hypothetical protein CHISP_2302 [Chitinispirillum alkaliphilum]|nr:hypothetical protein CHISP_2302 [Chitinispirillum alkaliphilum]
MKKGNIFLILIFLLITAIIAFDRYYVSNLQETFSELEKQRIVTSNKLATAKIVHENLNHVRELVFANMIFPEMEISDPHETQLFEFITTSINDLRLKLVSLKPLPPKTENGITIFSYDMEIEGDFFKFGELCAKFENSRRIISLESFNIDLLHNESSRNSENVGIRVNMRINTYMISKT